MSLPKKIYTLLLFVFFLSVGSKAQFPNLKFEHINEIQNLSHNTILDIIQDEEGFLWFATIDGLNRFDGYTCKVYKHNSNDSTSISSNFIHGLFVDTKGYLWITTRNGGLDKFDKYRDEFIHYMHDPSDPESISSNKTSSILQDKSGKYWVTTEEGLDQFSLGTGKFRHINIKDDKEHLSNTRELLSLYLDATGIIWITSVNGLTKFDPVTEKYQKFYSGKNKGKGLNDDYVHSLYREGNLLWITTYSGGLTQLDLKNNTFKTFYSQDIEANSKGYANLGEILPFKKNIFIIGSEGSGLFLFYKNEKKFRSIKHNPLNSYSISNNHISAIYKDNQDNIWIGTWGGAVNKIIAAGSKFEKYSNNPFNDNSISGPSVFALCKDNNGNVWIGTSSSHGLDKLNAKTGKFSRYNFGSTSLVLGASIVGAIYCDHQNNLWIASAGLIRFNPVKNKVKIFNYNPSNPGTISSNNIKCVTEDRAGNIWVGLEDGAGGVCKYDKKNKKWIRYLADIEAPLIVRYIYEDTKGNFWIATTGKGLAKLDIKNNKALFYKNDSEKPNSISYNDVRHIVETKNGELWIATYGGGIDRFDPAAEKFYTIKEKDGLSNNFTYAILEDKNENLWISTNYGLTKYNRKDSTFKIYTVEDGLQNNEFNTGAFYRAKDGEMFFGGVNGFNKFYPNKIIDNKHIPPVYLTSFKLLDKELIADTSIIFNKNIKISYFDKFFSVEFVALDYTDPAKNQYEYKLEGFDDKWIKADHRRYASYTNLNPGNYTLKVRGSNDDGVWNIKGANLNIIVTPPFWLEWWFISLSVTTLLVILISTVRYYSTRQLKEQIHQLEKEKAVQSERERISRDLHDNVGSQLTNIITGIGLAEIYSKSENKKANDLLSSLKNELRETMTQLRETIWALKASEMSLDNFINELGKLLERHTKYFSGKIDLDVNKSTEENIILKPLQALYVLRIIQEAITNSVKHSGAKNIFVLVSYKTHIFTVSVKDDGRGIAENQTEMINGNGIENMRKRAEEIGGNFEIKTSENNGVEIIVSLKV